MGPSACSCGPALHACCPVHAVGQLGACLLVGRCPSALHVPGQILMDSWVLSQVILWLARILLQHSCDVISRSGMPFGGTASPLACYLSSMRLNISAFKQKALDMFDVSRV